MKYQARVVKIVETTALIEIEVEEGQDPKQKILEYAYQYGKFKKLDERHEVRGLVETRLTRLEKGMKLKALRNMKGTSNSYNTPELIDIPKGTVLHAKNEGTRMGDAFTHIIEGECTKHVRHMYDKEVDGTLSTMSPTKDWIVGLRDGYESAPYSLGYIHLDYWEIV